MVKKLPAMQETQVQPPGQEDPLEKGVATLSSILAGEFHGQRSLAGYSTWGHKESDIAERLTHTHTHGRVLPYEALLSSNPMNSRCLLRLFSETGIFSNSLFLSFRITVAPYLCIDVHEYICMYLYIFLYPLPFQKCSM